MRGDNNMIIREKDLKQYSEYSKEVALIRNLFFWR